MKIFTPYKKFFTILLIVEICFSDSLCKASIGSGVGTFGNKILNFAKDKASENWGKLAILGALSGVGVLVGVAKKANTPQVSEYDKLQNSINSSPNDELLGLKKFMNTKKYKKIDEIKEEKAKNYAKEIIIKKSKQIEHFISRHPGSSLLGPFKVLDEGKSLNPLEDMQGEVGVNNIEALREALKKTENAKAIIVYLKSGKNTVNAIANIMNFLNFNNVSDIKKAHDLNEEEKSAIIDEIRAIIENAQEDTRNNKDGTLRYLRSAKAQGQEAFESALTIVTKREIFTWEQSMCNLGH